MKATLRDTLTLGAACGMALVGLYLVVGIGAALVQDQANPVWLAAFGQAAPLPTRIFQALETWLPRVAPIVAIALAVHCGLRRALRPQGDFGDDLLWDAILWPFPAGVVLALLAVALVAAFGARARDDILAAAMAAAVLGVVFGGAGLAGLIARFRLMRAMAVAIVAFLLVAPLARVGADAWGDARLAAQRRALEPEWAAEQRRMAGVRRPALREPVLDEDAAPRYRALEKEIARLSSAEQATLGSSVGAGPGAPLEPEALRLLGVHREHVRRLREALHCNRCVWEMRILAPHEPIPSPLPARALAYLLVVEGHQRARAGDAQGAAERYLDAVRFGTDLGEGPLIHSLIGIAVARTGLVALGRLLVSDRAPPLDQVRIETDKLEGHLPTLFTAFRVERFLLLGGLQKGVAEQPDQIFGARPILPLLVPYHLLAAQAVEAADPLWRDLERSAAAQDPREADRLVAAAAARPGPQWNPLFRMVAPNLARARVSSDDLAAWFALVKAAIIVEGRAGPMRRYPRDGSQLSLPTDPWAFPAPLRYAPTAGGGYKLWSLGSNRQDDGGGPPLLDLVLER